MWYVCDNVELEIFKAMKIDNNVQGWSTWNLIFRSDPTLSVKMQKAQDFRRLSRFYNFNNKKMNTNPKTFAISRDEEI